jgi:hypothetical protein
LIGAVLGAAFFGTIAYALIVDDPTDDGIVSACYDTGGKKAGKIRLVNAESDCKDTENFLQWPIVDEISDLEGSPCQVGDDEGTLEISFDAGTGEGSFRCEVPDPPDVCDSAPNGTSCSDDNVCTLGDECQSGECVAASIQSCDDGNECTADLCDPETGCVSVIDDTATCAGGTCQTGVCVPNGGTCTPGEQRSCYGGPPGTQDVGACQSGTATCDASGDFFGACNGDVVPTAEVCENGVDDDCDGQLDEDCT